MNETALDVNRSTRGSCEIIVINQTISHIEKKISLRVSRSFKYWQISSTVDSGWCRASNRLLLAVVLEMRSYLWQRDSSNGKGCCYWFLSIRSLLQAVWLLEYMRCPQLVARNCSYRQFRLHPRMVVSVRGNEIIVLEKAFINGGHIL